MQKSIQFSQWGVFETLYRTSFGNTAMKFLNSWPNSLHCLAETRLQGQLETRSMFHPPKMVSYLCYLNKIPLPSLFVEPPSSINGS